MSDQVGQAGDRARAHDKACADTSCSLVFCAGQVAAERERRLAAAAAQAEAPPSYEEAAEEVSGGLLGVVSVIGAIRGYRYYWAYRGVMVITGLLGL